MNAIVRGWRVAAAAFTAAAVIALPGCDAPDANGQGAPGAAQPAAQAAPDRSGQPTGARSADAPGAEGPVALGTFTAAAGDEAAAGLEARLPAPPAQTILIPDSALYPGAARLEANVENPYTGEDAIRAGERHFEAFNCSGCHAPLGGGGMGPPLSDDEWIHGSDPAQIYLSIMHGRPEGMPAWASMLPARTVWEMVAYIESLSEIDDYAAAKGFNLRGTQYPVDVPSAGEPGAPPQ